MNILEYFGAADGCLVELPAQSQSDNNLNCCQFGECASVFYIKLFLKDQQLPQAKRTPLKIPIELVIFG